MLDFPLTETALHLIFILWPLVFGVGMEAVQVFFIDSKGTYTFLDRVADAMSYTVLSYVAFFFATWDPWPVLFATGLYVGATVADKGAVTFEQLKKDALHSLQGLIGAVLFAFLGIRLGW